MIFESMWQLTFKKLPLVEFCCVSKYPQYLKTIEKPSLFQLHILWLFRLSSSTSTKAVDNVIPVTLNQARHLNTETLDCLVKFGALLKILA